MCYEPACALVQCPMQCTKVFYYPALTVAIILFPHLFFNTRNFFVVFIYNSFSALTLGCAAHSSRQRPVCTERFPQTLAPVRNGHRPTSCSTRTPPFFKKKTLPYTLILTGYHLQAQQGGSYQRCVRWERQAIWYRC